MANTLDVVTKVGHYAVAAFGAVVTGAVGVAAAGEGGEKGLALVSGFAVFTLLSAFFGYCHRQAWVRPRNEQAQRDEKQADLPLCKLLVFLSIQLLLIIALAIYVFVLLGP